MSDIAIKIENISKLYQLGTVSTQTLYGDLHRWWARVRGKEDPFQKIGTTNTLNSKNGEFVWALKDINIDIKQGEVVGVIGKNGAGKSTLLKVLSRVTAPTTGTITVSGRMASLLEVGTGFHPELTGRENIFLNGAIMGMTKSEIRSKLDAIINFSGVEKYIDTPVKRYSSGMYVRLAFAVAAHLEPEVLIVDEVLAVGDVEFQNKSFGKMSEISSSGRTILLVSHNMLAINSLCKNAVVFDNGNLIYSGSAKDCIDVYLSRNMTASHHTLAERTDRTGNGLVRVNDIELLTESGQRVNAVCAGQSFTMRFLYECTTNDTSLPLIPGISITNEFDQPILLHHSRLHGKTYKNISKTGYFDLCISSLHLVPGTYKVTYSIIANGEFVDSVNNAMELKVLEGSFANYTEIPPSTFGNVLLHAEWK